MKRKLDLNACACAGGRVDRKGAAETSDPLMHAKQPDTSVAVGVKPYAVVVNRKDTVFGILCQENTDMTRFGVSGAVVQRFLDNTVNARFVLVGEIVDKIAIKDFDD